VVYLRAVPEQRQVLPVCLLKLEVYREAATIFVLVSVALLAAGTMGYVSLDIRNLGCRILCHLVRDNPVAIFIDGYRCPLLDPCPLDLAGLVPASGEHALCWSGSTVKTTYLSPGPQHAR